MTKYGKEDRNPKEKRTKEVADILNVSYNSIRKYDLSNSMDTIYILMWIEKLFQEYEFKVNIPEKIIMI